MALSSTGVAEVRYGGSDTACGGTFNPGATFTSNGAATSATGSSPVFTSASYTFVSGDVGAKLFVKSGTNWIPGLYPIVSVSGGAATLDASVGSVVLYSTAGGFTALNTTAGCATTGSPTSGSWGVDYSQQDAAQYSLTSLTTAAANAIILTASASVNMIGNGLIITGGTNFTTGYYQINSVSAGVSVTVDRTCTSAAGASGTAGVGGGFATIGGVAAAGCAAVNGYTIFWKYNASVFLATSASTNVPGGCYATSATISIFGYDAARYNFVSSTNRPSFRVNSSVSSAVLFGGNNITIISNLILDGNSQTSSIGVSMSTSALIIGCKLTGFTGGAINSASAAVVGCEVTGCSTVIAVTANTVSFCNIHDNTISGVSCASLIKSLVYNNSGASSDGALISTSATVLVSGSIFYNNGRHGVNINVSSRPFVLVNNIFEGHAAGYGINITTNSPVLVQNCASYNNASGRFNNGGAFQIADISPILGSGSFFTAAGSGDFSLNNAAGAGALCRAAGFPATFPAGLTANYGDIGAAQHQDSGGGGVSGARIFTGF